MPQPENEIIDRAARAIADLQGGKWTDEEWERMRQFPFSTYADKCRMVRTVLGAIRTPTAEMCRVIARGINDDLPTEQIWEGAVDAALKGA
jgi:hypothetical protein